MQRLASRGLCDAIVTQFADGHEHASEEVAAWCGHLIPPELAIRELERKQRSPGLTLRDKVEKGRLGMIRKALAGLGAEPRGQTARTRWSRFCLAAEGDGVVYGMQKGSAHHGAKLNEEMVREIRLRYAFGSVLQKELAAEYGVSVGTIRDVLTRKCWRHVA